MINVPDNYESERFSNDSLVRETPLDEYSFDARLSKEGVRDDLVLSFIL